MTTPCAGQSDLFDATDVHSHRLAKTLCATCPVFDWCSAQLTEALAAAARTGDRVNYGPSGTWAGQLMGVPKNRRAA